MFGWNFKMRQVRQCLAHLILRETLRWTGKLLLLIPWHWEVDKKNRKKARASFLLQGAFKSKSLVYMFWFITWEILKIWALSKWKYSKNINTLLTLAKEVPKVKVLKILVQSENSIKCLSFGHTQWGILS